MGLDTTHGCWHGAYNWPVAFLGHTLQLSADKCILDCSKCGFFVNVAGMTLVQGFVKFKLVIGSCGGVPLYKPIANSPWFEYL